MNEQEEFRQKLIRFLESEDPNGCYSDADCERENIPATTFETGLSIVTTWAVEELEGDMNSGYVPREVKTFAEVHEYVDANKYGGAFEFGFDSSDLCLKFWNAVQQHLDEWIKARK